MNTPPARVQGAPPTMTPVPGLGRFVLRQWPIVVLAVIAVAAVGAAVGSARPVTYEARAQLIVGPVTSNPQALSGTVDQLSTIASRYANYATTSAVDTAVRDRLGVAAGADIGTVQIGAVAGNPLVRIVVQSPRSAVALRTTTVYAEVLRKKLDEQISPERQARSQLAAYSEANRALVAARAALSKVQQQHRSHPDAVGPAAVNAAQSRVNTADLRVKTLGDIYVQARQSAQSVAGVSIFDTARVTGDDGTETMLKWAAAGAAVGLLIGLALAQLLALRRRRILRRQL